MVYLDTNVRLNKDKSIGKVLFVVEGGRTEPYILRKIFTTIFDYQVETILRNKKYCKYNSKENLYSQVFVVNAEESNIKNIESDNDFLNQLFSDLIENYDFDLDNAAIYYIFDRDNKSNTDKMFLEELIGMLGNARDNAGFERQGMLLLSYPSVESFTVSNFIENTVDIRMETGHDLKCFAAQKKINPQKISSETLKMAVKELFNALETLGGDDIDLDDFSATNRSLYEVEENEYTQSGTYRLISLLTVALIDLGLIEVNDES